MSSLRLTTSLQQKMILTPQLRQRIEMLQMTAMELQDLIEQEMVSNPILEEVQPGEEVSEISENILDQNSDGHDDRPETAERTREGDAPSLEDYEPVRAEMTSENGSEPEYTADEAGESSGEDTSDAFEEIDYGREFQ